MQPFGRKPYYDEAWSIAMYPPRVRAHSWGLGLGLGSRGYLGLVKV